MAQCFLTGLEMELGDAFVLDVGATRRVVRDMKSQVARLERLVEQLGPTDHVQLPSFNGKAAYVRHHRRLVSRAVAEALAAACPGRELFVPWTAWCARGRILPLLALRDDPDYGARVRGLTTRDAQHLVALADEVLERVAPGISLSFQLRNAFVAGVCAVLRARPPEEVAEILSDRLRRGEDLTDLGVPFGVEAAFRAAFGNACRQPWAQLPVGGAMP